MSSPFTKHFENAVVGLYEVLAPLPEIEQAVTETLQVTQLEHVL